MHRRYIRFWDVKLDGRADVALGSDSIFYLDGRWARRTALEKARRHAMASGRRYVGMSFGESGPMIALEGDAR